MILGVAIRDDSRHHHHENHGRDENRSIARASPCRLAVPSRTTLPPLGNNGARIDPISYHARTLSGDMRYRNRNTSAALSTIGRTSIAPDRSPGQVRCTIHTVDSALSGTGLSAGCVLYCTRPPYCIVHDHDMTSPISVRPNALSNVPRVPSVPSREG